MVKHRQGVDVLLLVNEIRYKINNFKPRVPQE